MLHNDSAQDFLLIPVVLHLQRRPPIRPRPRFPPLLHRRRILVRAPSLHSNTLKNRALRERHQGDTVVRHREVERPETLIPPLVRWRLHDAVDRAFVEPARQHLERVSDVDDLVMRVSIRKGNKERAYEGVVLVLDPPPLAIWRHDLQGGNRLAPQDSNGSDVYNTLSVERYLPENMRRTGVSLQPHALRLLFVVLEARVADSVAHINQGKAKRAFSAYYFMNRAR